MVACTEPRSTSPDLIGKIPTRSGSQIPTLSESVAQHPRRPLASFLGLAPIFHSPSPLLLPSDHCPLTYPDPVGVTAPSRFKSFSCNTYGSPRKCCKQKTYSQAKPFRCNTYKKRGGGVPIMVNQESKKGFLSRGVPRVERFMDASLLNALFSCCLEFVAGEPARQRRQPCRLRSEHERKSGNDDVARKIHVRAVLVARLVIAVRRVILGLFLAPLRVMARV